MPEIWARTFAVTAAGLVLAAAHIVHAAGIGLADDYPNKPIRQVGASAPGGGIDIIGRIVAQGLSDLWQHPVIADSRGGGGGTISTDIVAKAAPDGYTLLVQSLGVAYVGALRRNLPFDVARDLAPVVLLASQPSLLAVHISVPANNVGELVQLAKSKPGHLHYGTAGAGGASHMGTELFSSAAGIRLTAIAYKGTGPAFAALLGGEIQLAMVGISTALPHTKAGRIRALGVTGAKRSVLMPEIPTINEAGVPGYEFDAWYGMFAPAKTPRAITAKINTAVNHVLQQPDIRQRFAGIGVEPLGGTEEKFAKFFLAEVARWDKVIQEAGIKAD
jgi:tripartite-type tricarboxylate transporter receptor subunit TctC